MDLRETVIRTVCYFDIFDYPLTRAEIQRWIYNSVPGHGLQLTEIPFSEVDATIFQLIAAGIFKEERGMVFFFDREGLVDIRANRFRHSCRKWKRARRWARIFSAVPGVELVGVGNTLAYHNAKDGSDIDLFIICAPGTIWRARFLCAALTAVCGLRPRLGNNRDKLCLSFFVTTDALDISKFKFSDNDIYLDYWIRLMVPLAGSNEVLNKFTKTNSGVRERGTITPSVKWSRLFKPLKNLPGNLLKEWQKKKFPREIKMAEEQNDGSVIATDSTLKFHANDRRRDIYKKWEKRVSLIMHGID